VQDQAAKPQPSKLCTTAKLRYSKISTLIALNLKKLLFFEVFKTLPISNDFLSVRHNVAPKSRGH